MNIPTCATWDPNGITVAGKANGAGGSDLSSLIYPTSIFIDNNDTLYIDDRDNSRIVKYYANATTGVLIAGTGFLGNTSFQLSGPKGVTVDQYGAVIVADSDNYRIQSFPVGSMSGNTLAINSALNPLGQMRGLSIDVNNGIYVADSDNHQVTKFLPFNSIGIIVAGGNGAGSSSTKLSSPYGSCVDENWTLYVADTGNHRIQKFPSGSTSGTTVAGITGTAGSTLTTLNGPIAIITDNNGYVIIILVSNRLKSNYWKKRISHVRNSSTFLGISILLTMEIAE